MARIALVTGATGGIGEKFVEKICLLDDIDEVWAVGRNREKLDALKNKSEKIVPVIADLSDGGTDVLKELFAEKKPEIRLLVNNAGVAYMGKFEEMSDSDLDRFCKINCTSPAVLMAASLKYMSDGARILNISSASSFQPNPYLSMYSASKAFLKNLSRAVGFELKERKITVTCVCPYWVDTGMLPREKDGKKIKYPGMVSVDKVVNKALKDSERGKDMSVPGLFASYFRLYSKITPTSLVMKQWVAAIKKYL